MIRAVVNHKEIGTASTSHSPTRGTHRAARSMPSNAGNSASANNQWASLSFVEVLEDLSSRFIVNLPSEELQRIERICFQVEQAHWFYEDFLRPLNTSLPSLNLRKFSIYILQTASLTVPLIRQYVSSGSDTTGQTIQWDDLGGATYGLEAAFDEFLKYKTRVPVCGAVLLCDDWKSCLLVKGWKSSASWGFPKGKINQSEAPRDCAIRETFEETGFDCSHLLKPDSKDWMELNVREQSIRLYIVPKVPRDTDFETKTRKEISKIAWFNLSDLPTWKQSKAGGGGGLSSANAGSKFYLVTPFIGKLKHWIQENKKRIMAEQGVPSAKILNSTESADHRPSGNQQPSCGVPAESVAMGPGKSEAPASSATQQSMINLKGQKHEIKSPILFPKHPSQQVAVADDQSAALLAMLKGSLSLNPPKTTAQTATDTYQIVSSNGLEQRSQNIQLQQRPVSSSSPLPAPRAQKSSGQTLKLLEMLSPNSPQLNKELLKLKTGPSPSQFTWVRAGALDTTSIEEERKRKRELLLQKMLDDASNDTPVPPDTTDARLQSAQVSPTASLGPQQQSLLALMNSGGNFSHSPQQRSQNGFVQPQEASSPSRPDVHFPLLSPQGQLARTVPPHSGTSMQGSSMIALAKTITPLTPTQHTQLRESAAAGPLGARGGLDSSHNAVLDMLDVGPRKQGDSSLTSLSSPLHPDSHLVHSFGSQVAILPHDALSQPPLLPPPGPSHYATFLHAPPPHLAHLGTSPQTPIHNSHLQQPPLPSQYHRFAPQASAPHAHKPLNFAAQQEQLQHFASLSPSPNSSLASRGPSQKANGLLALLNGPT